MTISDGFKRLRTNVGRFLHPSSPGPPDSPATDRKDALQRLRGLEAHYMSTFRPYASLRHVDEGAPTGIKGSGDSGPDASAGISPEDRSPGAPQPAAEEGQNEGGEELIDRAIDDLYHANRTAQTAAALAPSISDTRPTATVSTRLDKSDMAAFKWALKMMCEVAEPFAPLKAATNSLLNVWDRYDASDDVKEDFDRATKKMQAVNDVLKKHGYRSDMKDPMQSLADIMVLVRHQITRKDDRSRVRRMVNASDDAKDVDSAICMLGDVADLFLMHVTSSMDAKLDTLLENQLLDRLRFVSEASYDAITSDGCIDGTCVQLLAELLYWAVTEDDVPPVCFLNGPAGFGKTTVAYTMCKMLQGLGVLGGSFFCSRDAGVDRRSIRSIFSTLARSLTLVSRPYLVSLIEKLQKHPGASDYEPSKQYRVLFSDPQDWSKSANPERSTLSTEFKVFVIDALDECDDSDESTYNMLRILKNKVRGRHLRFLIVSRPEPRILKAFSTPNAGWSSIIRFQDVPEDVAMSDVSKYLRRELNGCAQDYSLSNWPSEDDLHQLELRARGLFIYAATACKYIATLGGNPRKRLSEVVQQGSTSEGGIDPMYRLVLNKALARQTTEERSITLQFLRALICLAEPLPLQGLVQLLQIDEDTLRMTVSVLHSVVYVPEPGSAAPVTTFHASFADYLLSPTRSSDQPWHIDPKSVHRDLFASCVCAMKQGLHFNVSQTRTSYARNEDQPYRQPIAAGLRYACLMWMSHLEDAAAALADAKQLEMVFPASFLFWLEVLSVEERTESGLKMMIGLLNWLGKRVPRYMILAPQDESKDSTAAFPDRQATISPDGFQGCADSRQSDAELLMGVARDAAGFMEAFAEPIAANAAHIYLSALMHDSSRHKMITPNRALYRNLPGVTTNQPCVPPLLTLDNEKAVTFVAFSPNGARIASGSPDSTIRLWDGGTGAAISEPLRGHEESVHSIAFSFDGTCIVSGSADKTIRLWDAEAGVSIGDPLRGHEEQVRSVACSPDGTRIASGSDDKTIRVWDVETRTVIGEPLCGHQGSVLAVAFSPGGTRIASGSYDTTIRLWDAETGAAIGDPLRGHDHWVTSVTFSPGGTRLASGSNDKTIRVWNTDTGAAIGDPIRGHKYSVWSVAFSPDGARIASGSLDKTVRLWDAETGAAIGDTLRGHDDWVWSVAFSPDGTRLASGSDDKTIRVWNTDTGAAIGDPIRGHEKSVWFVAFSPDRTRIASGSCDKTVRLWDAETGAAIGDPLRGHDHCINSVAFSPEGSRIASGSDDKTIRMWDTETGAAIGGPLRGHEDAVHCAAFSPDGTCIASGSWDKTIRLWDAETGAAIGDPLRGHESWVTSVAFSPDGTCLASGSGDKTVKLWDAETGTAIGDPLRGHKNSVTCVAFSPDGTRIVSGSYDRTVRLWDADSGAVVGKIRKTS